MLQGCTFLVWCAFPFVVGYIAFVPALRFYQGPSQTFSLIFGVTAASVRLIAGMLEVNELTTEL